MPNDIEVGLIPEVSMGFSVHASGPPHFVGAMPLRTDLQVLPLSEPIEGGHALGFNGENPWGPAPSHLYSDSDGGRVHINHGSMTEGDIRFHVQGGLEVIRIAANGDFFVHGTKVDNDHEIYQHFRKFLGMSFSLPVPDPRPRDGIETRYERILKKLDEDQ